MEWKAGPIGDPAGLADPGTPSPEGEHVAGGSGPPAMPDGRPSVGPVGIPGGEKVAPIIGPLPFLGIPHCGGDILALKASQSTAVA